jgi:hypothetical protein
VTFNAKKTKVKTSGHGVVDITNGRAALANHFNFGPCFGHATGEPIPVVIYGYIDGIHRHDDGKSREFTLDIEKIELKTSGEKA